MDWAIYVYQFLVFSLQPSTRIDSQRFFITILTIHDFFDGKNRRSFELPIASELIVLSARFRTLLNWWKKDLWFNLEKSIDLIDNEYIDAKATGRIKSLTVKEQLFEFTHN